MPTREQVLVVVKEWAEKAERDWLTASHLRWIQEDFAIEAMGFHAQQSAEKYLKSLLVLHGLPVPRTHDLLALIRLLPSVDAPVLPVEELQILASYAVVARYPGPTPVDHEEAIAAVAIAGQIRTQVRRLLPTELTESGQCG